MRGKYRNFARTVLTSGLAYVLSYLISLWLTQYITANSGTDAYGFVSLSRQFAQYAGIVTMALNSFASTYIALACHEGDWEKARKYFTSVFYGDLVLGGVILAAMTVVTVFLDHLLRIPENLVGDVKLLFFATFVYFFITTVFTVFECAAYITDRLDLTGIFKGVSYLVEALVLWILYSFFPARIFYVGIALTASALTVGLSNRWIAKKFTPGLVIRKKYFSRAAVKRLLSHGIWNSVNQVGDLLNSGLDLVICNLLLSPLAMGQLAIAKTIGTIFSSVLSVVGQAFQPMFLKSYATDKRKFMGELSMSMKLSGMFMNVGFAGFVALGMVYYRLWIPGEDIQLIYGLTIVTILIDITAGPMKPLYYIYSLTEKVMFPSIVTILGGVANVVGMVFLITRCHMGVYAVAWTTAVVMTFINLVTNPLYMAKVLQVQRRTFYPNILRNLLACAVVTVLFLALNRIFHPEGWISFILTALLYAAAGCLLHLAVVFDRSDWKKLKNKVRSKKHAVGKDQSTSK